jgi:hypothetical protein
MSTVNKNAKPDANPEIFEISQALAQQNFIIVKLKEDVRKAQRLARYF